MFYLTTSRPYTNAKPHLGTAMDAIFADSLNRFFNRLKDGNCFFSMGMDDHSFKVAEAAIKQNLSPKEFVDSKYQEFKDFWQALDIYFDDFSQTSTPKHHWVSNLVWNKLETKNLIYRKEYEGLYCKGCEDFYAPSQLVDGHCPIHPYLELEKVQESNYFFKLSALKDPVLEFLQKVVMPDKSILEEQKNFAQNLQDISISRDKNRISVDWGVTINNDSEQVMYVWFEALLSYLTPIIPDDLFHEYEEQSDTLEKQKIADKVWEILTKRLPIDLMIMGRDNAKFHLIILPAILYGLDLPLPSSALIHGMITDSQGRKFSKSLGNGVELEDFLSVVGKEGVRHFILHDCNSIGNTSFSWDRVIDSYNANLADNLGNLVVRVTNLIEKNLDGVVDLEAGKELFEWDEVYTSLQQLNPQKAIQGVFENASKINSYLEETKPWTLAKDMDKNQGRVREVLTNSARSLLEVAKVLAIFLPETGEKIYEAINADRIVKAPVLFPKLEHVES